MGKPGRVMKDDDGQWIPMSQARDGGRRVVQDRDFARDIICVSCDMGLQGRRSEWQPEVASGGGPGKMSSRLAKGRSFIFDVASAGFLNSN